VSQYINNPGMVFSDKPVQVAVNLWRDRFSIPIGDVSSVTYGYSIAVHRLTETEFILVLMGFTHTEASKITDAIRELTSSAPSEGMNEIDAP
jgi:hypothetical protein